MCVTTRETLTCMDVRIADTSYVGLQRFCSMSRQMPPSAYTLGWNILLTNRTVGGLFGYSSVNSIVSLKVPSSKGVSCGLQSTQAITHRPKTFRPVHTRNNPQSLHNTWHAQPSAISPALNFRKHLSLITQRSLPWE